MSSLATLELDDLDFRALTTSVVERIPAESGGQWTLHAPVDPGITLVDLFAYLLDQRVYWLDQIPDALLRGIFRLLGDAPRHARPAAAVFQLDDSAAPGPIDVVRAGARLALVGGTEDVVFTTGPELARLRVERVEVEVAGTDRTADVLRGRAVELFPSDGSPAAMRLGLALRGIAPGIVGRSASLLLRLATSPQLAPQWVATDEALAVGPPAASTWSYRSTTGGTRSLTVDDGTGGFRRSGVIRFVVPADWEPDAPPEPDGVSVHSIHVTTEAATFTAPPRLLEVVPNVAVARHAARETLRSEPLGKQLDEWLPLPGLTIELGAPGRVLDEPGTIRVRLRERDGQWHRWEATADLAFHGPGDRVFVVDRAAGVLRFGDGLTGRIPRLHPQGAQARARVRFQLGGGPSGNVGASLSWEAENTVGLTARNVVSAEGGTEPETLVEARERIRASLTRRDRAVTPRDFESIAESTRGRRHRAGSRGGRVPSRLPVHARAGSRDGVRRSRRASGRSSRARLSSPRRSRIPVRSTLLPPGWRRRASSGPRFSSARLATAASGSPSRFGPSPRTPPSFGRRSTASCGRTSTRSRAGTSRGAGRSASRSGRPPCCDARRPLSVSTPTSCRSPSGSTARRRTRTAATSRSARTTSSWQPM